MGSVEREARGFSDGVTRDAIAGLVAAFAVIPTSFSFAALIFSGPWQMFLSQGTAILLVSCAAIGCVTALMSGVPVIVGAPSSATAALLAIMLGELPASVMTHSPAVLLGTATAALFAATAATGLAMLALGATHLGRAIRFVPYPVLAGFMAASGWLMIGGAVRMATDVPLVPGALWQFRDPREDQLLFAVVAFAALLFLLGRRYRHPLVMPLLLVATAVLTDAALAGMGVSFETARAEGLLFTVAGQTRPTIPMLSGAVGNADWRAVLDVAPAMIPVVVIGVLQGLLVVTGLETALDTDADVDRELRAQGAANLVSAAAGGIVGIGTVTYTVLSANAGARGRLAGVVAGACALGLLAAGSQIIAMIPRFVLGGLLLTLGARLFWDWAIATRRRMPGWEWGLSLCLVPITAIFGFLPAMLLGGFGGCVLLALSMVRIGVIRRRYGVAEGPSSLLRPENEMRVLAARGAEAQILELRGFIFFGSAYQIYREVSQAVSAGRTRCVVLDFSGVEGIDAAAVAAFRRIGSVIQKAGARLIVAEMKPALSALLGKAVGPAYAAYGSTDEAVEAAETDILVRHGESSIANGSRADMLGWFADALGDEKLARDLATWITVDRHECGATLCRQGDATDTLLFIESGRVSVLVEAPGQPPVRVRAFGPHTVAGELAFLLGTPRTATLRVEEPATIGRLDRATYQALTRERPPIALALLDYLVRVQAERLTFANRMITSLRH